MSAYAWCVIDQWYNSEIPEKIEIFLCPRRIEIDNGCIVVLPDSEIFKSCIEALANNESCFKVNVDGCESYCEIIKYRIFDIDFVNLHKTKYECIDLRNDFITKIYVCGRNTICERNKHKVSSVKAKVYNLHRTKTVEMFVSKCNDRMHFEKPFLLKKL